VVKIRQIHLGQLAIPAFVLGMAIDAWGVTGLGNHHHHEIVLALSQVGVAIHAAVAGGFFLPRRSVTGGAFLLCLGMCVHPAQAGWASLVAQQARTE